MIESYVFCILYSGYIKDSISWINLIIGILKTCLRKYELPRAQSLSYTQFSISLFQDCLFITLRLSLYHSQTVSLSLFPGLSLYHYSMTISLSNVILSYMLRVFSNIQSMIGDNFPHAPHRNPFTNICYHWYQVSLLTNVVYRLEPCGVSIYSCDYSTKSALTICSYPKPQCMFIETGNRDRDPTIFLTSNHTSCVVEVVRNGGMVVVKN